MKGLTIHALLALAGLLFAYQTWTRPAVVESAPSDEVVLLQCKPEQLEELELALPTHHVRLRPEKGANGPAYWITATPNPKANKDAQAKVSADGGVAEATPAELKGVRTVDATAPVTFRGNAVTTGLLNELFPMRALRDLGKLDPSRDADFGFDKAGTTLKAKCGGKSITLTVAGRTYGNNDNYVRDQKTGKSYLMLGRLFTDLQAAQFKLMQTDLHAFKLDEVDEAVVKVGDRTRKLLQRDRSIKGKTQWVDADKPDQRNEAFGNWFARVSRMRARTYMPRGVDPGAELEGTYPPPVPVMQIDYKLEGKPQGSLEVVRVDNPNGERYYYGRSEATGTWVTLYGSSVDEVESDLPLVVGQSVSSSEP